VNSQWLVISPGGGIQLINGDSPQPSEDNWAVFAVHAGNFGIEINRISGDKEVAYNPRRAR
jgi:hypothetical protein